MYVVAPFVSCLLIVVEANNSDLNSFRLVPLTKVSGEDAKVASANEVDEITADFEEFIERLKANVPDPIVSTEDDCSLLH